ncbi:DedA family protein [Uliginosibacterium flavum]|uniref:DedA family protein n=1 Tax=Uliginosibacterium flavum TaxID=1396831 RepID=A0ABV2TMR5_9RHOO
MELITQFFELIMQFFDIVLHLDKFLPQLVAEYGNYIYVILFAIIFCETGLVVTPFLPGDSLLFVAGGVAALGGMDIFTLSGSLFLAAVLGDNVNYWIGRSLGPRVFKWEHSRLFNRAAFDKTHSYFEHHGGKTIIVARFMPIVRTFAPFVAGVAQMDYRRFLPLDILGGAIWIFSLTFAGYFLGNIPFIKNNLSVFVLGIIAVSLMPLFVAWLRSRKAQTAQP